MKYRTNTYENCTRIYGPHDHVVGIYEHDAQPAYTAAFIARLLEQAFKDGMAHKANEIRQALQVDQWGR